MPNLVGIGNSQVPTNAMLGGLAYQDSVGEIDIDKIKAKTSDTAVENGIFVYDTRKDSDGGAWRKRTKDTTWYNEGASSTRGNRKEFPAVAIIIAETQKITIYDGDDPNCPMWMIINRGTDTEPTMLWDGNNNNSCTSVAAKNGTIMWTTLAAGSYGADFIGERWIYFYNGATYSGFRHNGGGIINRNKAVSSRTVVRAFNGYPLASTHRQVAMTVRPNAEIDPVTKLPIPLIAIAGDDGLDFIKDNHKCNPSAMRDIVRIRGIHGGQNQLKYVDFDSKTHAAIFTSNYGSGTSANYKLSVAKVPSGSYDDANTYSDFQEHTRRIQTNGNVTIPKLQGNYIYGVKSAGGNGRYAVRTGDDTSSGLSTNTKGALNIMQEEPGKDWQQTNFPANSRIAYIASDYNTGWLHGNIKRANLATTDTTNVTGELIDLTNGEAVTGQAGNFSSVSANSLVAGTIASGALGRYNTGTDGSVLVANKRYLATLTISNYNGSGDLGVASGAGFDATFRFSANGTYQRYITYDSGEVQIFYRNTNTATIALSLQEIDIDRSLNCNGLGVFGTLNREPVAPGADLVAYSGFSASNYLASNYDNSNEDPTTGDFSISLWAKTSTQHIGIIWSIRNPSDATYWIQLWVDNADIEFGQTSGRVITAKTYNDGNWHCYTGVKTGGKMKLYFDGHLLGESNTNTAQDPTLNASSQYRIGNHHDNQHHFQGSIALVRYSLSGMSADIVEKIYEDEKLLFQDNAKCTLYGTSDEVKALAYDDDKEILHVGTPAGRSDFHRLNRINNTTTAVTDVMSASNGLIAER